MTVLAVVPARGSSKRLPRKNLRLLAGRPMLAWTLDAARGAPSVSRLVVSTEDDEIAAYAVGQGVEVPTRRPAELAADDTPGIAPILHMVRWLEAAEGYRPDVVLVLQPTSPLRTAEDIEGSLRVLDEKQGEAVASVCPAPFPSSWLKRVDRDGRLLDRFAGVETDGEYVLNGAIYIVRRDVLLTRETDAGDPTWAYVMPRERSVDVDTAFDFDQAEWLLQRARHA